LHAVNEQIITDASHNLVNRHGNAFADQKIVAQRHQVRVVPVTHVQYEWKGKQHSFYVYGYENRQGAKRTFVKTCYKTTFPSRVHLSKYPQRCCWGCTIV